MSNAIGVTIAVCVTLLIVPTGGYATDSFDDFGHAVVSGAKETGHTIEDGAKNVGQTVGYSARMVGHTIETGTKNFGRSVAKAWDAFKRNLNDGG